MANPIKHILVIKLSALGDFVQNLGLMKAIRDHHPDAYISLLTTKPYKNIAEQSGYFDEIIIDPRAKFFQFSKWNGLRKKLNKRNFDRVYDLQINDRSALYYKFLNTKPEWVGQLKKKDRDKTNLAFYRHKKLLEKVGVKNINIDSMDWMTSDLNQFKLKTPYALIVPGCAPTRPEKRWPTAHYIKICQHLIEQNIQPVLIGTKDEAEITSEIHQKYPETLDLTGKTSLFDIPPLAQKATFAVGNDTGPLHMIGPTGCLSLVLFSGSSDPDKHRPLGDNIYTIQEQDIADISPNIVIEKINDFMAL